MNQSKKSQILDNSVDEKLNMPHNGKDLDLYNKSIYKTEKRILSNEIFKSANNDISYINTNTNANTKKIKHKKINIFYKGKELINEEEKIGNLIFNNGSELLELSIIILSLNDSTIADENKIKEKLIDKITEKCQLHKNSKELYICTTCGMAFCTHCADKHKNHDIIERKNIIKFSNELKLLNEELNNSLNQSNAYNLYNLYNLYEAKENNNNNYNNSIEKLQNRIDNIKKMHKGIINNYKKDLDKILPYLLEYKEKIEQLIENSYKLDTIKDEKQFMDYYYWYTNIKDKNLKIKQEIENLENKREKFNKLLENFDEKLQNIFTKTEEEYKTIKNFYYNYNNNKNENQFRAIYSNSTILTNTNLNSTNNQNGPKLNLFNLLNQSNKSNSFEQKYNSRNISQKQILKEGKLSDVISNNGKEEIISKKSTSNFSDNNKILNKTNYINNQNMKEINNYEKLYYSQRIKPKKFEGFEKIEEKSEVDESQEESNISYCKNIYNIKPNSQNIYYFDFETRKVNEIAVNFNNLSIESFDQYQSTLNYENNFYISGGYYSSNLFCKYNQDENIFTPLKKLPSSHSCHGMLGIMNNIYIISGANSKKVEKYDINNNTWISLAEMKERHIWPNCLEYNNNYILVFDGKFNKNTKEDNAIIEKLDLSNINNKWEQLKFSFNNHYNLTFNFGLIHITNNSFLLIGGNGNKEEFKSGLNNCYQITINDEKIDIKENNEFKLSKKEEFNGKIFTKFKKYYYGEFSSLSYETFYLINTYNKTIKDIGL